MLGRRWWPRFSELGSDEENWRKSEMMLDSGWSFEKAPKEASDSDARGAIDAIDGPRGIRI